MNKVEMTRASWETILHILDEYAGRDWPRDKDRFVMAIHDDISNQIGGQD